MKETKECTKCKAEKPLTLEFFTRCSRSRGGFHPRCKTCKRADEKERVSRITHITPRMLKCPSCEVEYSATAENFYRDKRRPTGLQLRCKRCQRVCDRNASAKYRATDKGKKVRRDTQRDWRLKNPKREFNISLKEYEHMVEIQDGCCYICGRHESKMARTLAVDHDHNTGDIRGLLCSPCNMGIGIFKDSVQLLRRACEYLEKEPVYTAKLTVTNEAQHKRKKKPKGNENGKA